MRVRSNLCVKAKLGKMALDICRHEGLCLQRQPGGLSHIKLVDILAVAQLLQPGKGVGQTEFRKWVMLGLIKGQSRLSR